MYTLNVAIVLSQSFKPCSGLDKGLQKLASFEHGRPLKKLVIIVHFI